MKQINKKESLQMIGQPYLLLNLLEETEKNDFTKSKYYEEQFLMKNLKLKETLKNINIHNRGFLLLKLYSSLVIPKELKSYLKELNNLNSSFIDIMSESNSSYPYDKKNINYIKHIRNSVAHANVYFEDEKVIFQDIDLHNKYKANIIIKESDLSILCNKLDEIFAKYTKY